jgi:hypothetical protein
MLNILFLTTLIVAVWFFYPFAILSLSKKILPKSWREWLTSKFAADQNLQKELNYLKSIEFDK